MRIDNMRYNRSQIEKEKKRKPLRHFRSTSKQEPVVIPTPFPAEEKKPEEPAPEKAPAEKPEVEHKKNLKIKHKAVSYTHLTLPTKRIV